MLAGYLPFDDDPANPEGDNINLLYKYIVSTPLVFPEYVTPHARDLLRRILVPNPRKRADLFEVARHTWLSEYAHLVEFITSSTTSPSEAQNAAQAPEEYQDAPMVARSSSVRESAKQKTAHAAAVGGLAKTHGKIDADAEHARTPKDAKRRTVQVEYVAPTTQTQRGADPVASKPRARSSSRGPEETKASASKDKPLPQDPPVSRDTYSKSNAQTKRPPSSHKAVPPRASQGRAVSDNPYITNAAAAARPRTSNTLQNVQPTGMQSRGSYGQPAPPTVADTNAQGRIQQPSNNEDEPVGRPSVSIPPKFAQTAGFYAENPPNEVKGHRRSNTLGEIGSKLLGRNGSVFGGRNRNKPEQDKSRKYPPVSMSNSMIPGEETGPRPSMDSRISRRSFSLGLGKKRSGSISGSQDSKEKQDRRRFSLLPASFSLKSIGLGKEHSVSGTNPSSEVGSQQNLPIQDPRSGHVRSITSHGEARGSTPFFDNLNNEPGQQQQQQAPQQHDSTGNSSPVYHQRYGSAQLDNRRPSALPPYMQSGAHLNTGSDSSVDMRRPPTEPQLGQYQHGMAESSEGYDGRGLSSSRGDRGRGVLQKSHKRFTDAYEQDDYRGHEGSSGAAKRVMDFFRRRGKARGGEDR